VLPQTLTRSLLYVLVATAIHGLIVSLAGFAREILANSGLVRLLRRGLSAALALVAVWFAVTTAR
jgi:threonine/homoserine/homoserine lactone efflux protein